MMEPRLKITEITPSEFDAAALEVFRFQAEHNIVYSEYLRLLGIKGSAVKTILDIPFLPAGFFRNHDIVTGKWEPQTVFTSSGTTGALTARHYVKSLRLYEESFLGGFRQFYGDISEYAILALLPSYLEREGSSLVYMADRLIKESGCELSGFFLNNYEDLLGVLPAIKSSGRKAMIIGVTYALLNLAERYSPDLSDVIVVETGGMKGMRREMIREELHSKLNSAFGTKVIHSEYGMTELMSQAWSQGSGLFRCPPWMRVLAGDVNDPLSVTDATGSSGTINIIDLANIWSCSFLATSDLGRLHAEGSFEVTGRYDNSDVRGCNLLVV
jgi:hypothetical protein